MTTATKVNIKPLEDRVVVQANEAETTTASGLVIPDTAKEKPQEGTVIAVGPGRIDDNGNRVPLDVNVGFPPEAGSDAGWPVVGIYHGWGGTKLGLAGADAQRALTRGYAPDATEEQLLALPTVLTGTPRDIADTLRARRDSYGITYFTVQDYHAEYFAKVIAELR